MVCEVKGKLRGSGQRGPRSVCTAVSCSLGPHWLLLPSRSWSPQPCWHQLLGLLAGRLTMLLQHLEIQMSDSHSPPSLHLCTSRRLTWEHFGSCWGLQLCSSLGSLSHSPAIPCQSVHHCPWFKITWSLAQYPLSHPWLSTVLLCWQAAYRQLWVSGTPSVS